jgi:hypothetical protein
MMSVIKGLFYLTIIRRTAYAYLDPGSGSIIIQVVVAFLAGLIMLIKLYWGKIKLFFGRFSSKNSAPDMEEEDE